MSLRNSAVLDLIFNEKGKGRHLMNILKLFCSFVFRTRKFCLLSDCELVYIDSGWPSWPQTMTERCEMLERFLCSFDGGIGGGGRGRVGVVVLATDQTLGK